MEKLVRDKIMSYMEHAQIQEFSSGWFQVSLTKKSSDNVVVFFCFFLVLSFFLLKSNGQFQRNLLFFQRGSNFFQGEGGPTSFSEGVQTPCPPSGSALVEENRLFTKHQHGFRKGYSCVTQLIEVCEKWTEELDNTNSIDVVY